MTLALGGFFTTPEIRRLIARLILTVQHHPAIIWAWSQWRQAHQAIAAISHRKRRRKTQL